MTDDAAEPEQSVDVEGADATGGTDETGPAADLAARVAAHDEELAAEVRRLGERVAALEEDLATREAELEEYESRLKRKQADFENYKKRAQRREEEIRERATEAFVERVVEVRDNLVRALDQEGDEGLREGIESTLETFDQVLEEENVTPIEPAPGEEVDPERHEVLMRTESDRPEGTVVDLYRPGYEMAGRVVQTAQVTVSEGPDGSAE